MGLLSFALLCHLRLCNLGQVISILILKISACISILPMLLILLIFNPFFSALLDPLLMF